MICPFVEGVRISLAMAQDDDIIARVMGEVGKMHAHGATAAPVRMPDFVGGLAGVLARIEATLPEMASCARETAHVLGVAYRRLPPASPSLVHGDLHFGNVLRQDGPELRLVDFFATHVGDPAEDIAQWMLIAGIEIGQADKLVRLAHARPPPHQGLRVQLCLAAQHLHFACRMAGRPRPSEEARYFFNSLRYDLNQLQISCDLSAMEDIVYSTCLSRLQRRAGGALASVRQSLGRRERPGRGQDPRAAGLSRPGEEASPAIWALAPAAGPPSR